MGSLLLLINIAMIHSSVSSTAATITAIVSTASIGVQLPRS